MSMPIRRIGVVVPAHDEELVMARCLEWVGRAAQAVPLPVTVMVVLDDCRGRTERILPILPRRDHGRDGSLHRGGPARRRLCPAVRSARHRCHLARQYGCRLGRPHCLVRDQLDLALAGADTVVGTVRLSEEENTLARDSRLTTRRTHHGRDHPHVHGANLGVRGGAYISVGGFPPLPVHEDRLLLRRLDASGATVTRSTRIRVQTSAGLTGRCEGGFATTLRQLAFAS